MMVEGFRGYIKQLQAENEELKKMFKREQEWRQKYQAENVMLREALARWVEVSEWKTIVHIKAEEALNSTPETAKIQAVLEAAEAWKDEFMSFMQREYGDEAETHSDTKDWKLVEAVRDWKEE